MPEGPEVTTLVADLQLLVQYRSVFADTFLDSSGGLIKSHTSREAFHRELIGKQVISISRRGKWQIWELTGNKALVIHLGMYGSITLHTNTLESTRLTLYLLADGKHEFVLNYDDSRCFGRWYLWPKNEAWEFVNQRTGPDAMTIDLTTLRDILHTSKGVVGEALVNQYRISGIGNIYRAEILNLARVSPHLKCGRKMDDGAIARIADACRVILRRAVQLRGSSIADFVDGYGNPGGYTQYMLAYGKTGRKCCNPGCKGVIVHETLGGRSLFYCNRCQRNTNA